LESITQSEQNVKVKHVLWSQILIFIILSTIATISGFKVTMIIVSLFNDEHLVYIISSLFVELMAISMPIQTALFEGYLGLVTDDVAQVFFDFFPFCHG
jgi:hypothetical protein